MPKRFKLLTLIVLFLFSTFGFYCLLEQPSYAHSDYNSCTDECVTKLEACADAGYSLAYREYNLYLCFDICGDIYDPE